MCAIAGILGLEADTHTLDTMLKTMKRRGPDGSGVYSDQDIHLLHSRLAVIDPDGGKQPMLLSWQGKQYVLVYNGELYNTGEIRRDLKALGHNFQGHSDTEVVLHAYAEYGPDCLAQFNGIFAFAVLETQSRRVFLARDRAGVKPLFFMRHRGGLLFASEMKTILSFPSAKAHLDETGAAQLVLLGPGRLPGSGVFRDMEELEPGCCGFWENGKLTQHRYWKLLDREHRDSFHETVEKVRYLVTDAIKRQLVSDVPVGTFLSGGLDSSLISAVCAEEMRQQGKQLKTFSVDYENNARFFASNKFQPESDGDYIRLMQNALQTDHRWTVLTPEDLDAHLEEATLARDLPGMGDVDFSLLAFCKDIRQDVTVALSGECADEIFGGYPWYRDPEVRAREGFPWAQNTSERASLMNLNFDSEDFVRTAYQQTCDESDVLPGTSPEERRLRQMVNLNWRWFMQTLLDRKDRMSMYCSLEVRVPFCDHRIAEYLYSVPWHFKDYQGREKGLLRRAVEGLLPESVLYRKKSPYPKTFDPRYETLMEIRLRKIMQEEKSPLFHLINRKKLEAILSREMVWPWYGQLMRRPQMMAYFLQLEFWLRHYNVRMDF